MARVKSLGDRALRRSRAADRLFHTFVERLFANAEEADGDGKTVEALEWRTLAFGVQASFNRLQQQRPASIPLAAD